MKGTDKTGKFTDKEYEELASFLSGEANADNNELFKRFAADDRNETAKYWNETSTMMSDKDIDVDKAWNKLYSRINDEGITAGTNIIRRPLIRTVYFRIAATILLLAGIGSLLLVLNQNDMLIRRNVISTTAGQKNFQVDLPDGSSVILNRNTTIKYPRNFKKHGRNVTLAGEAFFNISPDKDNPFSIDAGNATIKVIGTSFNIITDNDSSDTEVFVKTGKVMVSDRTGERNIVLEPGFIGVMGPYSSEKYVNLDKNYMSWNSGILIYDGQTLATVIKDLRKVYDMEVVTDDPEISGYTWFTNGPLDNQPQETIIRLICISFNLSYSIDGNVFHLSKK